MAFIRGSAKIVRAYRQPFVRHLVAHISKDETWTVFLLYKVVGASSKTYDGGTLLINDRTVHVLQVFGWLPNDLSYMLNGIGPLPCLWVFVKGVPGKVYGQFFAIGTPGINLIEDGLQQFTAQV